MTPETPVVTALPDLRRISLDEMPALSPGAVDKVVRRVLPGSPETIELGTAFSSSI